MMKEIYDILDQIDDLDRQKKAYQPAIRKFTLDTSKPLTDRFYVWKTYCDKRYVLHSNSLEESFPKLYQIIQHYLMDIRDECTYEDLLYWYADETYEYALFFQTIEDFYEGLISDNFGGIT